jgi:hypothetical protein
VLINQWRDRQRRTQNALALTGSAALSALAETDPVAELDEVEFHQQLVTRAMQIMQADFQLASWMPACVTAPRPWVDARRWRNCPCRLAEICR